MFYLDIGSLTPRYFYQTRKNKNYMFRRLEIFFLDFHSFIKIYIIKQMNFNLIYISEGAFNNFYIKFCLFITNQTSTCTHLTVVACLESGGMCKMHSIRKYCSNYYNVHYKSYRNSLRKFTCKSALPLQLHL